MNFCASCTPFSSPGAAQPCVKRRALTDPPAVRSAENFLLHYFITSIYKHENNLNRSRYAQIFYRDKRPILIHSLF